MKKLSAKEKAIEMIGAKNVSALEDLGITLSWKFEYDLKEFALATEKDEEVLLKFEQLEIR